MLYFGAPPCPHRHAQMPRHTHTDSYSLITTRLSFINTITRAAWQGVMGSTCNTGDSGLIPGSGRSPEEGTGYQLQYSWAHTHTHTHTHPGYSLQLSRSLKSLLQHHSSKASVLWHSAFFMDQLSHSQAFLVGSCLNSFPAFITKPT